MCMYSDPMYGKYYSNKFMSFVKLFSHTQGAECIERVEKFLYLDWLGGMLAVSLVLVIVWMGLLGSASLNRQHGYFLQYQQNKKIYHE